MLIVVLAVAALAWLLTLAVVAGACRSAALGDRALGRPEPGPGEARLRLVA